MHLSLYSKRSNCTSRRLIAYPTARSISNGQAKPAPDTTEIARATAPFRPLFRAPTDQPADGTRHMPATWSRNGVARRRAADPQFWWHNAEVFC
jgi:hypothetical protein